MTAPNWPAVPWLPLPSSDIREPFSGAVSQMFRLFSPNVTVNGLGDPQIEGQIVRDVATYGAQLSPIIEIVLALAKKNNVANDAVTELEAIQVQIQTKKKWLRRSPTVRARSALEELEKSDPRALATLIQRFQARGANRQGESGDQPEVQATA